MPFTKDPLVEEGRERGRAYTARLGNSIPRIFEDLRRRHREQAERYVSRVTVVAGDRKSKEIP